MFGGGFTVSELRAEVADNSVGFLSSNSPRNGNGLSAPETSTDSDDEADFRDARETLNSPESQTSLARTPRPERPSGCEGLFCAMQIAYNCKRHLSQGNMEEGLKLLMVACYRSVFALGVFRSSVKRIVKAITLVGSVQPKFKDQGALLQLDIARALAWSAHALLCGYREVDTDFDLLHALEPTFLVHHLFDRALGNLPEGSIAWVHASSRLKMYWSLYSSSDGEILERQATERQKARQAEAARSGRNIERGLLDCGDLPKPPAEAMQADITWMLENRSRHPATLQAVHLWSQRLKQQQLHQQNDSQLPGPRLTLLQYNFSGSIVQPRPDDMRAGFRSALQEFEDPAAAMQHLLFCMYEGLVTCRGKPDPDQMDELTWAADQVINMHGLLAHVDLETGETLWEVASERLVVAMLLLARSFDLQKILKGHRLLLLMVKEKRNLSEMYKELAEQDALSGFPPSDSDSEDDREHQCSACRKTRKRADMIECQRCRKVIYCSKDCQRKHAVHHKQLCLQQQLRQRQHQKVLRKRS